MKKSKPWMKIGLSIFIIIALVGGGTFGYTFYQLSKIKTIKISKTDVDLGIKPSVAVKEEESSEIINIAFFGLDRREASEASRSDSIMILSIDQKNKKLKISSVMRDTYVQIKDHGQTKINHAYAYGGPQLAIRTLNENFNLDIRDYVTVDFFILEKLVNSVGGVTLDVKQDQIGQLNGLIAGIAKIENKPTTPITKSGLQTLNGLQVVAYSRIRHEAGDDYARTERQRMILTAMLTKIQSVGVTEFPTVVSNILPFTETSMNSIDVLKLGTKVISSNTMTLDQARFPVDGYSTGKTIGGVWYLVADMKATVEQIHKFIYENIKPGV
jgi:LCP family protein required for cell wall assembly